MGILNKKFGVGDVVRDRVSELTGVAIYKTEVITGTIQYAVQPGGTKDKLAEAHYIDEQQLEFVKKGPVKAVQPDYSQVKIKLGDEVEEQITGFRGIATERITYLNGCVHFDCYSKCKMDGERGPVTRRDHFDHKLLKKVGEGARALAPKLDQPVEPSRPRAPGGPTRSASIHR
jgi:hypothetical protein